MLATVLYTFLLVGYVSCKRSFMDRIPNGHKVPNPRSPGSYWEAVGHTIPDDDDGLNPFGEDFKSAGKEWTVGLCQKDSDGDGRSNGVELGDPDCKWSPHSTPSGPATSHPGFRDSPSGQGGFTGMTVTPFEPRTEANQHHNSHEHKCDSHHHEHKECKEEHNHESEKKIHELEKLIKDLIG